MKKLLFLILIVLLFTTIAQAERIVVLMTDFSLENEAVGSCHGVILKINPEINIVDLCHEVTPYDILEGALMLRSSKYFPKGTVFVNVIDPGVGTERNSLALKTKEGYYFIAPNNGLLTFVIKEQGIEDVYELDPLKVDPEWKEGTFDGRDLYSPSGAILATSGGDLFSVGHPLDEERIIYLDIKEVSINNGEITGTYIKRDRPFGNVWTNITKEDMNSQGIEYGNTISVDFEGQKMDLPFLLSFGDVEKGKPLAYINSSGTLAFAIDQGNFADTYGLGVGITVKVKKK